MVCVVFEDERGVASTTHALKVMGSDRTVSSVRREIDCAEKCRGKEGVAQYVGLGEGTPCVGLLFTPGGGPLSTVCPCVAARRTAVHRLLDTGVRAALGQWHRQGIFYRDLHRDNVIVDNADAPTTMHIVDVESLTIKGHTTDKVFTANDDLKLLDRVLSLYP